MKLFGKQETQGPEEIRKAILAQIKEHLEKADEALVQPNYLEFISHIKQIWDVSHPFSNVTIDWTSAIEKPRGVGTSDEEKAQALRVFCMAWEKHEYYHPTSNTKVILSDDKRVDVQLSYVDRQRIDEALLNFRNWKGYSTGVTVKKENAEAWDKLAIEAIRSQKSRARRQAEWVALVLNAVLSLVYAISIVIALSAFVPWVGVSGSIILMSMLIVVGVGLFTSSNEYITQNVTQFLAGHYPWSFLFDYYNSKGQKIKLNWKDKFLIGLGLIIAGGTGFAVFYMTLNMISGFGVLSLFGVSVFSGLTVPPVAIILALIVGTIAVLTALSTLRRVMSLRLKLKNSDKKSFLAFVKERVLSKFDSHYAIEEAKQSARKLAAKKGITDPLEIEKMEADALKRLKFSKYVMIGGIVVLILIAVGVALFSAFSASSLALNIVGHWHGIGPIIAEVLFAVALFGVVVLGKLPYAIGNAVGTAEILAHKFIREFDKTLMLLSIASAVLSIVFLGATPLGFTGIALSSAVLFGMIGYNAVKHYREEWAQFKKLGSQGEQPEGLIYDIFGECKELIWFAVKLPVSFGIYLKDLLISTQSMLEDFDVALLRKERITELTENEALACDGGLSRLFDGSGDDSEQQDIVFEVSGTSFNRINISEQALKKIEDENQIRERQNRSKGNFFRRLFKK